MSGPPLIGGVWDEILKDPDIVNFLLGVILGSLVASFILALLFYPVTLVVEFVRSRHSTNSSSENPFMSALSIALIHWGRMFWVMAVATIAIAIILPFYFWLTNLFGANPNVIFEFWELSLDASVCWFLGFAVVVLLIIIPLAWYISIFRELGY
jgi:hypothetical protein